MKKYFFSALAAVAMLNLTSCLSEEEVNLTKGEMGHISLNISADNDLSTRAVQTVADNTAWFAFIDGASTDFGTAETHRPITDLEDFGFPAGNYVVTVSKYASYDTAMPNNSKGNAYWEGTQGDANNQTPANTTVTAGSNQTVNIVCGKAKNAQLKILNGGFAGTLTSVTVTGKMHDGTTSRTVSFASGDIDSDEADCEPGYFYAAEVLSLSIAYTINGHTTTAPHTMTLGGAGTKNLLTIRSNSNGTITLGTITYDDEFTNGNVTEEVVINAATGEKVVNP